MTGTTKIQLSAEESELVQNSGWIRTKQAIIGKVYDLFGRLCDAYKNEREEEWLPAGGGKISKGENYEGLPWVMLDYPALFSKEKILAVRTFFWWGNFFSVALHVSGETAHDFSGEEIKNFLVQKDFYVCIHKGEWHHHFEKDNFVPAVSIPAGQWSVLTAKNFFKVAKKISLAEWPAAPGFLLNCFGEILQLLALSYRGGRTGL